MLCVNCGTAIEEGQRFCIRCGASATAGQTAVSEGISVAGISGASTADPNKTAIRAVSDGEAPPPPVFTPGVAPLPPPQGETPGYGVAYGAGYGTGWQPPQGPPPGSPLGFPQGTPPGRNRTGLVVGSIVAAIIVLAGAGVGLWLGLRDDGGKTDTTKVVSGTTGSGTTGSVTTGTGGSVTTSGGTTSSSDGAVTTQTIPSLTTTSSGSTSTTEDLLTEWYIAHENLVMEMDYDHGRIPELADAINAGAPDVPDWVYGELSDMADTLEAVSQTMADTPVPLGFDDAHYWIMQAATHMANRIQATMDGISLMWSTGSINSATASFNTGRAERDAYVAALEEHYSYMPSD